MRLFHFCPKEYAIKNIASSRLKIATIKQLNDPYEFIVNFYSGNTQVSDETVEKIKEDLNEKMGIVCFSKRSGDPVQWAHYAKNHTGICLEFNVEIKFLLKINYRKHPKAVNADADNWWELFAEATKTKFQHWKYEKEHRLIVNLESKNLIHENGLKFVPFSEGLKLAAIYLGCNCELYPQEESIVYSNNIPVFNTKKSRNMFLIEKA